MKNPRGSLENPQNNDDCRLLAPFVMTLFDGEADELEARRARAHLLVCQTCANRWLDWNRSRELFHTVPVPAPPPQLLWRVLMACRLAVLSQRAPEKTKSSAIPNHLSAQILSRTTRAVAKPSRPAFVPLRMSAWAAPALAVWLLVLQRDAWLPAPTAPLSRPFSRTQNLRVSEARRARSTPETPDSPHASTSTSSSNLVSNAGKTSEPESVQSSRVSRLAAASSSASPRVSLVSARPLSVSRRIEDQAQEDQTQTASFSASGTADQTPQRPSAILPTQPGTAPQLLVTPTRLASPRSAIFSDLRSARTPQIARLAALALPTRARRGQMMGGQIASSMELDLEQNLKRARPLITRAESPRPAPQRLRVSLPSTSAPQATQLLAENFEADDEGIEEIRSVVDDFRATLGPDDDSTSTESNPDDDLGST